MVQANNLQALRHQPDSSRPTYQKYPHKKSLQPMVLRELSELHATVRFFTGYTDGSLEQNDEMVMRQMKRRDVFIVYDGATGIGNIVLQEDTRSLAQEEACP